LLPVSSRVSILVVPNEVEPEEGDVLESAELGTIQLGRRVGRGGMGRVYEACRPNLPSAIFAVKFLSSTLLGDEDALRRFSEEARRLSELNHRSIVRVQGYGLTRFGPCIVMELLQGESLGKLLKRLNGGVLDREVACHFIVEVLEGLHHVHERGVVHRDIKGDNIILTTTHGELTVKLVDFGIAKQITVDPKTMGGMLVGTPSTAAPEQLRGGVIGFWTDIYQVGVLAYHLLAGRHPFEEAVLQNNMAVIMRAHILEEPPSLAQFAPDLPADVVGAVMTMLRKEPAQRALPGRDGRPDGSARAFKAPFRAYARLLENQQQSDRGASTTHDQRLVRKIEGVGTTPADFPAHAAPAVPAGQAREVTLSAPGIPAPGAAAGAQMTPPSAINRSFSSTTAPSMNTAAPLPRSTSATPWLLGALMLLMASISAGSVVLLLHRRAVHAAAATPTDSAPVISSVLSAPSPSSIPVATAAATATASAPPSAPVADETPPPPPASEAPPAQPVPPARPKPKPAGHAGTASSSSNQPWGLGVFGN
jgi:serine/threonine-protein kinase